MAKIYLDYNASTPLVPQVRTAMLPYLEQDYGNPSSQHLAGSPARAAVEQARGQAANLLGCAPDEIVFTSGGTEANNHALKGVFFARRDRGNHIITSQIEHPAILAPCRFLERLGAEVTCVPVDGAGMVDPEDVRRAITPRTVLVSVMHANNEVGTIQPLAEIGRIAHEHGILFHTDAAQSVGKIAAGVDDLGVDRQVAAIARPVLGRIARKLRPAGGIERPSDPTPAEHAQRQLCRQNRRGRSGPDARGCRLNRFGLP